MRQPPRSLLAIDAKTLVSRALKGLFEFSSYSTWNYGHSGPYEVWPTHGSKVNYAIEAGDLKDSSMVMACINWITRTFPQAPIKIMDVGDEDNPEQIKNHPLVQLLRRPNPYYSGLNLWKPTLMDLNLDGNAYWRKVRNGDKRTIALYYEPYWNMRPRRKSGTEFISHYEIWRNREWQEIKSEEIVHFRNGLNPANEMYGLSPLASALREVFTDNEAARFTSSLFMNRGVMGALVSPEIGFQIDDPQRIKQHLTETTTGDRRGEYTVVSVPTRVQWPQIDPSKMVATDARRTPEERVAALLGVPAVVAQLGAGLDKSTYNNFDQAVETAWNSNLLPTYMVIADDLDIQLLPEFGDPAKQDIVFDTSGIKVLQSDNNNHQIQVRLATQAGIFTVNEARLEFGLPPLDGGDFTLPEYLSTRGFAASGTAPLEDADKPEPGDEIAGDIAKALVLSNGHKGDHK